MSETLVITYDNRKYTIKGFSRYAFGRFEVIVRIVDSSGKVFFRRLDGMPSEWTNMGTVCSKDYFIVYKYAYIYLFRLADMLHVDRESTEVVVDVPVCNKVDTGNYNGLNLSYVGMISVINDNRILIAGVDAATTKLAVMSIPDFDLVVSTELGPGVSVADIDRLPNGNLIVSCVDSTGRSDAIVVYTFDSQLMAISKKMFGHRK
jgi:hypothetical protein